MGLKQLLCDHEWVLVKHQIGTSVAMLSTRCEKCDKYEDWFMRVSPHCEVREPVDLFGRKH